MGLVDTAELIAYLKLQDELSGPTTHAKGELAGLESQAENTTAKVSTLSRISTGAGNSMSHLRMRAGQLAQGIGLVGLGGGVLALTGFIKSSVGAAEEFGATVDRVVALTRMSTAAASQFSDALGYYGISGQKQISIIGMYEKSVASLTATQKSATKFQKDYGFSLTDSAGHVKNAQEIITSFTDYFNNKSIPTQVRAAAGAKLFGRSWQDLIPIFQQGGTEWKKQLGAGMQLTDQQVKDLHAMRDAQKEYTDAMGDFQVQAGLVVLPVLKDLAHAAAQFLNDPHNQATLLGFLHQGVQLARDFGGWIANTVLPTIMSLGQTAQRFWNAIPGPLRDLLTTGLAADRVIKFAFGFSPIGIVTSAVGDAFKGLIGNLFGRGSPGNPEHVFIDGGIGLGGGAGGGGVAGGKGGSRLGTALGAIGAVTIAGSSLIALAETFASFQAGVAKDQADLQSQANAASDQKASEALANLARFTEHLNSSQGLDRVLGDTFGGKQEVDALSNLADALVSNGNLNAADTVTAIDELKAAQALALSKGNTEVAAHIGADIAKLQAKVPTASQVGAQVDAHNHKTPDELRRQAAQQARHAAQLQRQQHSDASHGNQLLGQIANQPTRITVNTTNNVAVSTRDIDRAQSTSSRYGFVAS